MHRKAKYSEEFKRDAVAKESWGDFILFLFGFLNRLGLGLLSWEHEFLPFLGTGLMMHSGDT